jgi:hypothetical protein
MNISKADAISQLAKWFDAGTRVRATYTTVTGSATVVGNIKDLSAAQIKVSGSGCDILLYFRTTSEYDYKDTLETPSEANKGRGNKYPTVIDVKFSNGDRLQILECFDEVCA